MRLLPTKFTYNLRYTKNILGEIGILLTVVGDNLKIYIILCCQDIIVVAPRIIVNYQLPSLVTYGRWCIFRNTLSTFREFDHRAFDAYISWSILQIISD